MEAEINISPLSLPAAYEMLSSGHPERAYSIMEKYVQLYPDHALGHKMLIACKAATGRPYDHHLRDFSSRFFLAGGSLPSSFEDLAQRALAFRKAVIPADEARTGTPESHAEKENAEKAVAPGTGDLSADPAPIEAPPLKDTPVSDSMPAEKEDEEGENLTTFDMENSATETLAGILAAQEAWDSAINAYEVLIRKFPGKREHYLGEIEKIKARAEAADGNI